jgi:hypothetical protein
MISKITRIIFLLKDIFVNIPLLSPIFIVNLIIVRNFGIFKIKIDIFVQLVKKKIIDVIFHMKTKITRIIIILNDIFVKKNHYFTNN